MSAMASDMAAVTAAVKGMQQQQQTPTAGGASDDPTYEHGSDPNSDLRAVPLNFRLEAANVMVGWRFWRLGNKYAGKENNQPVRPYKDIDPKVDFAGKSKEFKKLRKQYSDWNKVYTYIEAKLDVIAQPSSAGWRTKTPSHYQTLMTITTRIIPDGKILGVNKRATQPSQNSVSTVCRLIRVQTSMASDAAGSL
jgi:hypothetical protein